MPADRHLQSTNPARACTHLGSALCECLSALVWSQCSACRRVAAAVRTRARARHRYAKVSARLAALAVTVHLGGAAIYQHSCIACALQHPKQRPPLACATARIASSPMACARAHSFFLGCAGSSAANEALELLHNTLTRRETTPATRPRPLNDTCACLLLFFLFFSFFFFVFFFPLVCFVSFFFFFSFFFVAFSRTVPIVERLDGT